MHTLELLPGELVVVRLPPHTTAEDLCALLATPAQPLASVSRTSDEVSVVCGEVAWAGQAPLLPLARVERGWRAFRVVGPLPFDAVGILASITQPLAAAGVSLFSLSTFDTDYVLIKSANLGAAEIALAGAGHVWRVPLAVPL